MRGSGNRCYTDQSVLLKFRPHEQYLHASILSYFSLSTQIHLNFLSRFFCFPVLNRPEEVILPDRQDMSHPDQSPDHPTTGCRHQSHACLQESRTRDRSGETLPQPRAQPRVQRRSVHLIYYETEKKFLLIFHLRNHCML